MVEAIRQGDIPGVQLRVRQPVAASIDELWRWLDERDRWTSWACDRWEAAEEGDAAHWLTDEPDGATTIETLTPLRSEPPLLLEVAFRRPEWDTPTHVLFEIARGPSGDATTAELSILHRHFERLPLSHGLTLWEHYRRRWRAAGERLAGAIAER